MSDNPWRGFKDDDYELVDIGRPAVFLIPQAVLIPEIRHVIEEFLKQTFGGFQSPRSLVSGVYTTDDGDVALDDCVQFEVSFKGKDRIHSLARMLANVAQRTGEEAIYLKAGEDASLLRPRKRQDR